MKAQLSDIPDLVHAENPLEWAWENLRFVGAGEHRSIFAHPERDDVVLRVGDYPDGWFGYADLLHEVGANEYAVGLEHAPGIHDMAVRDGFYIAACDRLDPVTGDDLEAVGWIGVASALICGEEVLPADLASFRAAQPGFDEFLGRLPAAFRDVRRHENFMLRGRTLVVNDPSGALPYDREEVLAAKWAPAPASAIAP